MPTYETNTEFMDRIMNFCPHGALVQVFVIEALRQYSAAVADPEAYVPDTDVLSGQAWKNTAQWVHAQLEQHLGQ